MREQHQHEQLRLVVCAVHGAHERHCDVRRHVVRVLMQRRLSPVRWGLRQQQQRQLVRDLVRRVPRSAGQLDGDVRRNVVRVRLQRRIPPVRRRVRLEHEHGKLWVVVPSVSRSGELDGDV